MDDILNELESIDENILVADGFEEALMGYVECLGRSTVALYDKEKCVKVLMNDGMEEEDAWEYLSFNVMGAYVGEYTPAFATILK